MSHRQKERENKREKEKDGEETRSARGEFRGPNNRIDFFSSSSSHGGEAWLANNNSWSWIGWLSRAYLSVRQRSRKAFKTETRLAGRLKNEAAAKLDIP